MKLTVLPGAYAVLRFPPDQTVPQGVFQGEFATVSRSPEELSVVAEERLTEGLGAAKVEAGFNAIKVEGPLDFSLTGILARLASPLADAKISLFAVSTFDTDYVLVRAHALARARRVLEQAGFTFSSE